MKTNGLLLGLFVIISVSCESHTASLYGLDYNPEDFVVAQPTCVHRLPLTRVNRLWRGKGIRSFTVLNNTKLVHDLNDDPSSRENLESYGYWEDDSLGRGTWRGGNVGDTRAAVTPFLAHSHFGETYKWMLYGDDDTLFYMTGVLKLLSQFDPEQPLAITDNIWFYAQHTNPGAPRCLPCGFNTSTIVTNHTFTPRPACPFCTRALACGTYGPRYRCNAAHIATLESEFGPTVFAAGANGAASGAAAADAARFHGTMRSTAARFSSWMDHHVDLKSKYPYDYRDKPSMDWEMRDWADWHTAADVAAETTDDTSGDARRRRRRGRGRARQRQRRRILHDLSSESHPPGADLDPDLGQINVDDDPDLAADSDPDYDLDYDAEMDLGREPRDARQHHGDNGEQLEQGQGEGQQWQGDQGQGQGQPNGPSARRRRRQLRGRRVLAARKRPVAQGYVDGSRWISAALGRRLGGPEDPERQALQLPYPFCARHDDRLHRAPAPSCLLSVSGHGGTGIIFSVGLMRMIDPEEALRFIMAQRGCGGGDCLLGRLIWFRMGIGFTDPGTALQYGAGKYEKYCRFVDSNEQLSQIAALSDPASMLLGRRRAIPRAQPCDRSCVWLIENVVGLHVRAQNRQTNATVMEMLKRIESHRRAYDWVLAARRDPAVAAGNMTVVRWIKSRFANVTFPNISAAILQEYHQALGSLDATAISSTTTSATSTTTSASSTSLEEAGLGLLAGDTGGVEGLA